MGYLGPHISHLRDKQRPEAEGRFAPGLFPRPGDRQRAPATARPVPDRAADDAARRAFVQDLVVRLFILGTDRLAWQVRTIEPFGVTGLVVTARGIAGAVQVIPVSVGAHEGRERRSYGTFPGPGEPRYELRISDGPADGWASHPSLYFVSADPGQIAAVVGAWRDATPPPRLVTPPLGPDDLAPLRALAAVHRRLEALPADADWATRGLVRGVDPARPPIGLAGAARALLDADLAAIDPTRLLAQMPRDERGRLLLGAEVLLASYSASESLPPGKACWLIARAPKHRRDEQLVYLNLDILAGDEQRHRWDEARWRWDRRDTADETARWGVADLPIRRLGLAGRASELARLDQRRQQGTLTPTEAAARCILLQDEGRLAEAFAACGVELGHEVTALLEGGAGRRLSDRQALAWPRALRAALRAAAPWRFATLLDAASARLARAGVDERRRHPRARLRLLTLPHQAGPCKVSLVLAEAADDRTPRLELDATDSRAILPEVAWQRARDLDLRRFGLS